MAEVKTGYHGEITSAGGGAKEWMRAFLGLFYMIMFFFVSCWFGNVTLLDQRLRVCR